MKKDNMILAGAVLFAGLLVGQKTGIFKKMSVLSAKDITAPLLGAPTAPNRGYNPADPGHYVMVDDLLGGATENDWSYIPTFNQTVDTVLGGAPNTGSIIKVEQEGKWW